ncbi:MAG: isoprenylcysteine carboxylmethyltransferase family protein [Bacteroidia bacterium]|nr:isoprenylcysteine carboxylmethyltransferase family protein [Bacteroidia bacterium]
MFRKTGINPFNSIAKSNLNGFNEKVLIFCSLLISVIILNYVFLPNNYLYLIPINYFENELWQYIGMGLSAVGFFIATIAQVQMQNSWRIGVGESDNVELIKHGLFKYSRNPIYLGLMLAFIGLFFMTPNAVTLCFLLLMYSSLEIKIRIEENHLLNQIGEKYQSYQSKVRRWI